ncbi:terminase TerL endonuclease subunit [Streptomyces sp. CBMA123]|uniref:terminase TerL endonuclease subunit n=1 Tax=Streptomyces sp. CBMA123 TaxID=1896313 RepID=UPI001661FFED|nr:terminase TerL endonuclease subunit [Streptomyces sp. CBMA123]
MDETHHWVESNHGVYVFETLDRNVRKTSGAGSRWVQTTNAYNPAENSVAQRVAESTSKSRLYDCREAPRNIDLDDEAALLAGLREAYGDSHWVDFSGLVDAIQDKATTPASVAYRFYLNNIAEGADGWMSKEEWDGSFSDSDPISPGDQIAVGFDGSLRGDSTGLVGCRLRDGRLFLLGLWEKPREAGPDWEVDVLGVEAAVKRAFETYSVEWMYCDPPYWQEPIGRWSLQYGDDTVYEFWTNRPTRMTNAIERFRTAVSTGDLSHDGSEHITRHVMNAVTREVPQGLLIQKNSPKSKKKIDLAVCSVLAFEARADAIADGRLFKRRRRVAGF